MKIEIPELCVVALIGASGSGKSTFAKKHFKATEVLSSDYFRALVSDDENDQSATAAAFESLYYIADKRLENSKLTVIDATSVQFHARQQIINLARSQDIFAVAIVLDIPEDVCLKHNELRRDRQVPPQVIKRQIRDLKQSLRRLQKERFRYVHIISSPQEADSLEIVRTKLWNDKRDDTGPFDIIGDIHGCYDELCELLEKLGYITDKSAYNAIPPAGRKAIFLGDLCDRGPANISVLRLTMNMAEAGSAICLPGNHDVKLLRKLRGSDVKLTHGLDLTVNELEQESAEFKDKVKQFLDGLISHYVLDRGRLVVSHAGLREKYQGRSSGRVREFCLYGETTGETDEFGLPVRIDWAEEYRGKALVVYGHIPSAEVRSYNNTICIDTGCVFGGKLTAYRYPEGELVEVPAKKEYYASAKPLDCRTSGSCNEPDIVDILGSRRIQTLLHRDIPISEEASSLTLEIMSRFSANPRWLIYLPPTMSPSGTSRLGAFLEHPLEAFDYYKKRGVTKIICEEKHMGSRAVIVLCKDNETAWTRFGIQEPSVEAPGIIYTRTGRHFFSGAEKDHEQIILARLHAALSKSGFWDTFNTGWVCLDTELMPWSAKARSLIQEQYASTGAAGRGGLSKAIEALQAAAANAQVSNNEKNPNAIKIESGTPGNMDIAAALTDYKNRLECFELYTEAYRRYCWPVNSADDYRIAPFHILATEGKVWRDENHLRHLAVISEYITESDASNNAKQIFIETNHLTADLNDEASVKAAIDWWLNLTGSGGEGMVVKPLDFIAREKDKLLQPAVKCRGREYLRIIYGPDYTTPVHLDRLRQRSLHRKQSLALAEFALGIESLERFVKKEPFHRVHECAFAVLALENEEVDPRL